MIPRSEARRRQKPHARWDASLIAILFRQRLYPATVLLAALIFGAVTLVLRDSSDAATIKASAPNTASPSPDPMVTAPPNDNGLVWRPGDITQTKDADGGCFVNTTGSVSSADSAIETVLVNALNDVPEQTVEIEGQDSYGLGNVTDATVPGKATLDCQLISQVTYTFNAQHPGTQSVVFQVPRSALRSGVPVWLKGAVGIVATTLVYIAVSAVVIATMAALGAAIAPSGGLSSVALGLLAGCIGGAAGDAVGLAVAGVDTQPLSVVGELVAGCVTGAALESLPVHSAGTWLATELRSALGGGAAAVGGKALTDAAASAAVELTPISQAVESTAAALGNL